MKNRGFTVVEAIVSITLIAMMASVFYSVVRHEPNPEVVEIEKSIQVVMNCTLYVNKDIPGARLYGCKLPNGVVCYGESTRYPMSCVKE